MKDIVFPDKNEQEFISLAQTLGYEELIFVYDNPDKFYKKLSKVVITNALLCAPRKVQNCKKKVDLVFVQSKQASCR